MKRFTKKTSGFTLIEVIIAASIFSIVSVMAINIFVSVIRTQRRVSLENAMYEDARVMMERIAREVRGNTVDYEEYYNKASDFEPLEFDSLPGLDLNPLKVKHNPFGNRYGCYSKRFYNPGSAGPEKGDFGAYCSKPPDTPESSPDCVVNKTTLDINTGENPFTGILAGKTSPDAANAFCDANFAGGSCGLAMDSNHNEQNELYLVNAKGTEKTILARKEISSDHVEHALAMLRLTGQDKDKDGVAEVWRACAPGNAFCCSTGFICTDDFTKNTLENTLIYDVNPFKGFVPLSPSRTDVISLKFLVAPLEDPRKAFAETDAALQIQQQAHVTIILTVQPSRNALTAYEGQTPKVTLQTTVTSRVYNEVKSYYNKVVVGEGVCKDYL